ncbi:MAG: DUF362 domain-containing protein [candidate division WOR-3 bacterium]
MANVKSSIYFVPADRINSGIEKVLQLSGFLDALPYRHKLGVKVHFGEDGNNNYLSPKIVRTVIEVVSQRGVQPVLLETTTLYRGKRACAKSHVELALTHGFRLQEVLAPIEIIDGKIGENYYTVPTNLPNVKNAKIGRGLRKIDLLLNLAHFKGHFVTGFGGAIKNIGMGLAAKAGKLDMHSVSKPYVNSEKCRSCGDCLSVCPVDAISFVRYVAKIGPSCYGCASCIAVCPHGAIQVKWNEASAMTQFKIAEYAKAILDKRKAFHFNFLINLTPNCDCYPHTEKPFLPDIGFLASYDPVAIDQAAYDKVKDHLKEIYSHINPEITLEHAEKIGLGSRSYQIIEVE